MIAGRQWTSYTVLFADTCTCGLVDARQPFIMNIAESIKWNSYKCIHQYIRISYHNQSPMSLNLSVNQLG